MRFCNPIITILFFIWSTSVFAQINTIKFEHYTADEGLSQSTVKCIQQDELGFMWFGTINGLNQFDGLQFTSFHFDPKDSTSLTGSNITTLFEDSKGNLWIGTTDGLNLFKRATNNFQRYIHLENNLNSLPNNYIHDILEDTSGNLWIATKGGLCKYDIQTNRFENFQKEDNPSKGMSSNNVRCLYEDSNKDLWIGYFGLDGLQKFDRDNQLFTSVLYNQEETDSSSLNVTIWDIFEDSEGNFWLGTDDYGLILFDRATLSFQVFRENNQNKASINAATITAIEEDNEGNLLLATEGGGLNVLNLENFDSTAPQFAAYQVQPLNAYSINDNFLQSLYKDKAGLIWIGSKDSGVNKIDKGIQKFTHYQSNQLTGNNLTNKDIWSIMQDHVGSVWVGTADGLNRIDAERINIEYFFHTPGASSTLTGNHIYSIYQDKSLDIWIGTDEGLNHLPFAKILSPSFIQYRRETSEKQPISSNLIRAMLEDGKGNFWVGTDKGLNLMNRQEGSFKQFYNPKSEESNHIHCLLLDKKERLWLGTEKGLVRYNPLSRKFTNYLNEESIPNGLSSNIIHCLFEDINGNLWLGTPEGLNKMTEKEGKITFESFTRNNNLPGNTIYAIRGDRKGNLWLSTNTGLTKFNPRKDEIKNFTNKDGLQDGEFNPNASYKNWKGELFFGGSDGLNIFLPEVLPINQQEPQVVLTDFIIDYKSVPMMAGGQLEQHISIADKVTLFPEDNSKSFSFRFAALNYTQSDKNTYAYKLENKDDTWKYPNQNIAFYDNVPPGNYTFRVKAANNDGKWNDQGISIKVAIQPTFVQTWYFKASLILGAIGLGYLIYLNRVRSLRQRSETLEKMVKERTEQLENKTQQLEYQQEELENKNEELASTVKTLKETQQQLVVSEKMASLGQLTAGIAHEINNPINFISSNVQALKMDFQDMQNVLKKVKELEKTTNPSKLTNELIRLGQQLDFDLLEEEISELLAGIERGTERTVNIVSSLRIFSRNSTDNFSKADIHEGLDSTITILNSQFNGHITIEKGYGNLPPVTCQISRLNQVFLNIINNSIQAINTPSYGILHHGIIKIKTQKIEQQVQISIKDNGGGMNKETLNRLFEPFYTTKDVGEGTGLGLSISYGIIEQHKGKIEVYSQLGKGTEFIIHLPIERKEELAVSS
ncbi:MAG: two-component regulator propeller domain-containing protein [Saprospiraceae bacterium]